MGNCVASCSAGSKKELSSEYAWEQKVMEENILKSGKIFRAAIVSSSNGELRAAGPKGFRPNTKGTELYSESVRLPVAMLLTLAVMSKTTSIHLTNLVLLCIGEAIQHIIKALEGDTSGIAEDMIDLGGGCSVCSPGKVDPGKAIYGADGKGGGCAIFKTKECVLITVYRSDPAPATRLAAEVAEYMEEDNNK